MWRGAGLNGPLTSIKGDTMPEIVVVLLEIENLEKLITLLVKI